MSKNPKTDDQQLIGYPNIEALLESEDFEKINATFAEGYQKLEKITKDNSVGMKTRKDAQSAMKAYELTAELIKHLLKVKYEIVQKGEETQTASPRKKV